MNVLPAWKNYVTGSGIVVGVVDGGVFNHPDLNLDPNLTFRPFEDSTYDKSHGTNVAGVIAARKNDIFGIGVAFEAIIADIRLLNNHLTPQIMKDALTHRLDSIHIFSNSYTNYGNGMSIHHLHKEVEQALQVGTSRGRGGQGTIYVWSTGNYGGDGFLRDYCTYEGLNNNPWVISVAGIAYDLSKLTSGEQCCSMFISAFTKEEGDHIHQIKTTDGLNGSTPYFGRNSAAVPMVSGAIALLLQANQNVGYRDVMHLLVKTANSNLPFHPDDFVLNGAGLKTSVTFGFGLLDIGRLVQESREWQNVPKEIYCENIFNQEQIPQTLNDRIQMSVSPSYCGIEELEHVTIYLNVSSNRAGFLEITLTSPCGTNTTIIPGRHIDYRKVLTINVTSVQFWGENPSGMWILQVNDIVPVNGILFSWHIHMIGMASVRKLYSGQKCNSYYEETTSASLTKNITFGNGIGSTVSGTKSTAERQTGTSFSTNLLLSSYLSTAVTHLPNKSADYTTISTTKKQNSDNLVFIIPLIILCVILIIFLVLLVLYKLRKKKSFSLKMHEIR
ncbi:furin-like [Saccostrea cucullata]|uniref:furin-like n=1 Tax=Saccostrea cuccullata TaxID=36930 RepID=UPI002ED0A2B4